MATKTPSPHISPKITHLSIAEKLDIIPSILYTAGNFILALFTGLIYPKKIRPEGYYRHVALTVLRTFSNQATPRQQHYLNPSTDDAYLIACKRRGVQPKSEIMEDGTVAHWIGDNRAEKLIINFHGGGYVLPASPAFFEFMFQTVDFAIANNYSIACLFLSYDLAPEAIYPRQLQQAAVLLNHVLSTLKIPPGNIIMIGDSAGANLMLSLLSHISHPHPSNSLNIPKVELVSPFRGIVLVSPWVSFGTGNDSFKRNKYKDCVCQKAGKKWSTAFLANPWPHVNGTDFYNEPLSADESWWKDFQVKDVLVIAGEEEILVDGITEFESKLRRGVEGSSINTNITFEVAKGEYHDQPNIDLAIGYSEKDEGKQAKTIKSWICNKFSI